MYGDETKVPQIIPVQVLSDIHSNLGYRYVPYNELPSINTKEVNVNNTFTPAKYM